MTPHNQSIPVGLCQCGCGQVPPIAKQNHTKRNMRVGEPQRFILGHVGYLKRLSFETTPATRRCKKCGEIKPKESFGLVNKKFPTQYPYCKQCCVENHRQLPLEYQLFHNAKRRAKKKGVPFSLKRSDLDIPEICPILGMPMKRNRDAIGRNSYTVDEIVPGLGYVPGNVQVISFRANAMKQDANSEELLRFADWVYRMYKS
jgi:hypothetical protein